MKRIAHRKIHLLYLFSFLLFLVFPLTTSAQFAVPCIDQGAPCISGFGILIEAILRITWVVFTVIAVILFLAAGVLFLTSQGDPEKVKRARSAVLWGLVGIVVAILAFSVITIVGSVFV